jgi:hypothetical protein
LIRSQGRAEEEAEKKDGRRERSAAERRKSRKCNSEVYGIREVSGHVSLYRRSRRGVLS